MNEKFVDPFGKSGDPKGNEGDPHLGEEPVTPVKELNDENPDPEEQRPVPKGVFISTPDAVELPRDIEAIWGHSTEDRATARHLIDAWGLEAFRDSQLHKAALQEARSAKDRAANQRAFLDAQKRLKK